VIRSREKIGKITDHEDRHYTFSSTPLLPHPS